MREDKPEIKADSLESPFDRFGDELANLRSEFVHAIVESWVKVMAVVGSVLLAALLFG